MVSVCSEYNHVRSWSVTRFRGMISTQPGSTPVASFKILSLEEVDSNLGYTVGNDFGKLLSIYYEFNKIISRCFVVNSENEYYQFI